VSTTQASAFGVAESAPLFHAITEAADSASVGLVVLKPASNGVDEAELLYVNRSLAQLVGLSPHEVHVRGFESLVPSAECALAQVLRGYDQAGPPSLHCALQHRDGRAMPVEIALGPVNLAGVPALVLFISDVRARPSTEAALHRSEAQFQHVVDHATEGIFILRWPTVLYANAAGARILEFERNEDAMGLDISGRIHGPDAAFAAERLRLRDASGGSAEPRQYRGRNPSGSEFSVEVSTVAVTFAGAPAVLAFARDVTERDLMLARLGDAEKLAAVHALAAGVAHEINNPLAYVLLNLEVLARELPELGGNPARVAALQRRLADTRQGAERVKNIVRDLQALTRKDEGIRGLVELDQVIEHALHLAKRELPKRAQVITRFERVRCVLGNPTRLEQLFFNLILNAAQAMSELDPSERRLQISLRAGDGCVVVEIEDNGCGMSGLVLSRAFEPFFTTKPLGVGAGLGLAICKRIVDDLAGQITLRSQPLRGACVWIQLPHGDQDAPRAEPPQPARRAKLLLIDDERAVAESLSHALQDEHDVDIALSARAARALLAAGHDYDMILCDLAMPVESGAELYGQALREWPELAERFVFMTGGAFTARTIKFLEDSARPHVEKPFELDALRQLLRTSLLRRRS
jgi:PAS domain S-box-containing protein